MTIGVFDGVHKGHQLLIGEVVKRAADLGVRSVVVTFDPHPAELLAAGPPPAVLTELATKADLIESLGVDGLCVVPFTREFAQLTAERFVKDVLVDSLQAALVLVGSKFRFGRDAAGDAALLRQLGNGCGFVFAEAELLLGPEVVISSTYVRERIAAGDVAAAEAALGRPHRVSGVVVSGDRRGRSMGFPTANLAVTRGAAIPADGVYAGWLVRAGTRLPAAMSVGTNPTFDGTDRRVEAHVLDFSGDLYGERVALEFVTRLRDMRRYSAIEQLVHQLETDVIMTRAALAPARDTLG